MEYVPLEIVIIALLTTILKMLNATAVLFTRTIETAFPSVDMVTAGIVAMLTAGKLETTTGGNVDTTTLGRVET